MSLSRRQFLDRLTMGMSSIALADLLGSSAGAMTARPGLPGLPHFAPKAKRVIFLFMSGGMTQFETFDYKPKLIEMSGKELPDSYKGGKMKLLGMSGNQASFPLVGPSTPFSQHGQSGAWVNDAFPHMAEVADDLCFIKSMRSDAVNHDPAMTFMHTGATLPGRPSMGSWISYGLGSENSDLPSFVVLISRRGFDQPLSSRLWDSAFLPTPYQGVQFRAAKDPVLYLSNPKGISPETAQRSLNHFRKLQELKGADAPEAEIQSRLEQYEMAFRLQTSVPETTSVEGEPDHVFDLYGPDSRKPGSFAANCILARRMAERGVRFVQLFHPGWDMHGHLPDGIQEQTKQVDQAASALIRDLKDRGLLDSTLVVFGSEFGRTCYSQGRIRSTPPEYGREHHRDGFTFWLAGAGIKPGMCYGETDELGYTVAENPVHVNDFHATLLHLLGVDHKRLTFRFQGRDYRLTDLAGEVVKPVLA